jgi:hypothetical protein
MARKGGRVQNLERAKPRKKFRIPSRHLGLVCIALPVLAVIFLSHSVSRPVETTQAVRLVKSPKFTIIDVEQGKQTVKTTAHYVPKLSYTSASTSSLHGHDELNSTHNLWDDSTVFPAWMKDYFAWHAQERSLLTAENHQSQRFLVLRCLASDQTCGGASDRLKPLPILIKLAAQSNRLFFIYWSRPCMLEEFLVPVLGGLDWTVPEWLVPELAGVKSSRLYTKVSLIISWIGNTKHSFFSLSHPFLKFFR